MTEEQQLAFLKEASAKIDELYDINPYMEKDAGGKLAQFGSRVLGAGKRVFGDLIPGAGKRVAAPATKAEGAAASTAAPKTEVPHTTTAPYGEPAHAPSNAAKVEGAAAKAEGAAADEAAAKAEAEAAKIDETIDKNDPGFLMKHIKGIGMTGAGGLGMLGSYGYGNSRGYDAGNAEGSAAATADAANFINKNLIPSLQNYYQQQANYANGNTDWWSRLLALFTGALPQIQFQSPGTISNDFLNQVAQNKTPWMERSEQANNNA